MPQLNNRVVITGLGAVTSIGIGHKAFFDNLTAGKSGISLIEGLDTSAYTTRIGSQIKNFDAGQFMDKKEARKLVRFIQFAIAGAKLAVEDAKLKIDESNACDVGVLVGSGIGGIDFFEEQVVILKNKGPSRISPFAVPYMICNMAAGMVSIHLGIKGPNSCVATACATGTHSIGDAYRILQRGDAKAMVAGGSEAPITPLGLGAFCAARALSTNNNNPEKASRPFEKNRDGFVMGEGAGIVVLETLDHALSRGANIYAEVVGYGMSGDAFHMTAPAPNGEGASRAINLALKDAGLNCEDIDYVNAHGTSTELNDKYETMAIKKSFGERAKKLLISSNKSMIGHLLGAAGAIELIATSLTIKNGIVPPTINHDEADPECDLNYVPNHSIKADIKAAISNSFGFGGHNAVLAIKKYEA
ncbi:MAG: beta-ketoacyl-acyl-carrier-protein synthase II [Candidatus Saganbacteria bacterium]|uniref:3-oxoacyl-[acyl-carrier-protein] synthase 2 n=1 Tax=Candidatus Saganbacteria bacterium TaxID=2575572 RepID=A0A833L0R4_UNCSA|nr:MAG: beta-ketoacyl-acyl-carrier-protein synthase II [Candidatus Saganbacteria bacterium]